MKEFSKENIIINKNIHDVYNLLYNNNERFITSLVNLIDYKKGSWENNKKKDFISIKIDDIPDILVLKFIPDKILNIKCKHTITKFSDNEYNITTKYKLINKSNLIQIANLLKLINITNNITLNVIDNSTSVLSANTKIKTFIMPPYKELIESFSILYCKQLLENTIGLLV